MTYLGIRLGWQVIYKHIEFINMAIDYKFSKLIIRGFRGIDELELEFRDGYPSVLIGTNNAGKSTILNAIALALNGGGYHQWSPSEADFHCSTDGTRVSDFLIQIHFCSDNEHGYPAVKGVAKPSLIRGIQVKGKKSKDGRLSHSRTLFDADGKTVTIEPRTSLTAQDKETFASHDIGFKKINARLDDIRDHMPEVWLFKPQNIEASLYLWKTGPIAKLSGFLAKRFLIDKWEVSREKGNSSPMPETMHKAYEFFQHALEEFPLWKDDMKPHLEEVIGRYVGTHAKVELRPNAQLFEDWISQQLMISLATDPESVATPLRNMGDGWQSVVRLAALEALSKYPDLTKERVVLLLEEPETHLHPHLRRKLRKVLASLAAKGWTVVYATHSPELVSFDSKQVITRLVRMAGKVSSANVVTDAVERDAKLQAKLDERGAHDFLFSTAAIFCEGPSDSFALKLGFDSTGLDYDARSVSVTQCGSCSAIPAFVAISKQLGIRWCALTDEDKLPDGNIKSATADTRNKIDTFRTASDLSAIWPVDLEHCLGVLSGKAKAEIVSERLACTDWKANYPYFVATLDELAQWIGSN